MADTFEQDDQGRTYKNGVLQVQSGTPGVGGGIHDLIQALAGAFAPRSIADRQKRISQQVDEDSNAPQTTDKGQELGQQF